MPTHEPAHQTAHQPAHEAPGRWEPTHPARHDRELLAIYLNDHLAGSAAGLSRFRAAARAHRGTPAGDVLAELATEIAEDRRTLRRLMRELGVERQRLRQVAARIAEKLSRLKLNGRVVRRSPLGSVFDLEVLLMGVEGKAAGWRSLQVLAPRDERLDGALLEQLVQRADSQLERIEELRRTAVAEALGGRRHERENVAVSPRAT
ncbi:hypothetical protein [Kineococcus terrestris]|uniref:hypothetical protein n=1 Tax=Kineococcus terrestris TaxID=2044856 RepID=UPI0034DB1DBC